MKILYLIGGTMGVGKTVVSQQLKKDLPNSVFLDGDWCWDADPFQVTEETQVMVMSNMHEQAIIDSITDRLDTDDCKVIKISLTTDEINLRNRLSSDIARGIRTADVIERSLARIYMYSALDTVKVDTSNKTIREIADEIIAL